MLKVSTTGMAVPLKMDLRFPISGQQGHGDRIIQAVIIDALKNKYSLPDLLKKT